MWVQCYTKCFPLHSRETMHISITLLRKLLSPSRRTFWEIFAMAPWQSRILPPWTEKLNLLWILRSALYFAFQAHLWEGCVFWNCSYFILRIVWLLRITRLPIVKCFHVRRSYNFPKSSVKVNLSHLQVICLVLTLCFKVVYVY